MKHKKIGAMLVLMVFIMLAFTVVGHAYFDTDSTSYEKSDRKSVV